MCSVLHFFSSPWDIVVRKLGGNPRRSHWATYMNQSWVHIYNLQLSAHLQLLRRLKPALRASQGNAESCLASSKFLKIQSSSRLWNWFNNWLERNEDLWTCHRAFYMLIKRSIEGSIERLIWKALNSAVIRCTAGAWELDCTLVNINLLCCIQTEKNNQTITTNWYCLFVLSVFIDHLVAAQLFSFLFCFQSCWWSGVCEKMAFLLPWFVSSSALPFLFLICGKRTHKCHSEGVAAAATTAFSTTIVLLRYKPWPRWSLE